MYLLDTNVASELRKASSGRIDANVLRWSQSAPPPLCHLSAMSVLELEIGVPDAFIGDVAGLLGSKGSKIENMADRGGHKTVSALAPLRQMFGFSTELRSATQGRAGLTMRFSKFDLLQ